MKMKITLIVLAGAIIPIIIFFAYYGLFAKVVIIEKNIDAFWIVYEKHIGDYKKTGEVMDKIYYGLAGNGVNTTKGFGIYYDNPQQVKKTKLRSVIGCILDNKDIGRIDELQTKYKIKKYPASHSVTVEFPFKGKPSIFIGIFKIYPKLFDFIKTKNYNQTPILEIYNVPNNKIEYIASVDITPQTFNNFLSD